MSIEFDSDIRELLDRLAPPPEQLPGWDEVTARAARPTSPAEAETATVQDGYRSWRPNWVRLPGQRRWFVAVAGGVAVAAAVVVTLIAPWQTGTVLLNQAQAAIVVRHVIAAVSTGGGVFHERYEVTGVPFAGARRVVTVTTELWQQRDTGRFRSASDAISPSTRIEIGSATDPAGLAIYDSRTNAIYRLPHSYAMLPLGPASSASELSHFADTLSEQLVGGKLGEGWSVTKATLDGRDVYRISNAATSPTGPTGITYYADAQTYAPVRIEEPGPPKNQPGGTLTAPRRSVFYTRRTPATTTVTRILTYEQLDPTQANLDQLDLHTAHPDAAQLPFGDLRADVKQHLIPISTAPQPSPTPSAGANQARLTVDPATAAIGNFHVGDKLLALSPLLGGMPQNFGIRPGNFQDAAAVGTLDANGILVVTFSDLAEEHSTSAYLSRPFTTTRGDINNSPKMHNGTPLDEFLSHWPDHGTPTTKIGPNWRTTTVKVGQATFYFGFDNRLGAVALGDGDAASYATP